MENAKKSILEMARGGFMELVDYEMAKVIDNSSHYQSSALPHVPGA